MSLFGSTGLISRAIQEIQAQQQGMPSAQPTIQQPTIQQPTAQQIISQAPLLKQFAPEQRVPVLNQQDGAATTMFGGMAIPNNIVEMIRASGVGQMMQQPQVGVTEPTQQPQISAPQPTQQVGIAPPQPIVSINDIIGRFGSGGMSSLL
jgi:hypothetical protein